jgi:hypothetical protein
LPLADPLRPLAVPIPDIAAAATAAVVVVATAEASEEAEGEVDMVCPVMHSPSTLEAAA